MPEEEIQNIFDDAIELKKVNPWLAAFALTDNEIKEIIKLISRIILGSVRMDDFFSEMKKVIRKDEESIKKITISAINNRFLPLKDQISGVETLLSKLGESNIEIKEENKTQAVLKPSAPVSFFHEDDEEIKQIISSSTESFNVHDYSSLAELVISESGYSIDGDEIILNRLKNAIVARLKDIRDEMETMETLQKSRKIGGLEMTPDQAKKIITLIKEKIDQGLLTLVEQKTESLSAINFPVKKPFVNGKTTLEAKRNNVISQTPVSDLKKVEERKVEKPILPSVLQIEEEDGLPVIKSPQGDDLMIKPKIVNFGTEKTISSVTSISKEKTFPSIPSIPPSPVKPLNIEPEIVKPAIVPQPQPMPKSTPMPKTVKFGRQSVDGVSLGKMLVGPVEELATMTLINFRRLGETPHRITAKIKEKINLLENDSYGKKLEGIDAWHRSEVNRFYRLLGQESMRQGRSIDDIINERMQENKPTLSIEEFNSVMELNKDLRY